MFPLFPYCFFKSTMLYFSIICRLSKDTPFERFADTSGKCGEKIITGEAAADKLVGLTEIIAEKCFAGLCIIRGLKDGRIMMPRVMIKKGIAGLLVFVLLLTSLPLTAFAGTTTAVAEENEYIYYSDLFYGYSYYLTLNTYLAGLEKKTTEVTTNILNEYITTGHFKASAVFEGIGIAVDPTSVAKYVSDNMGLSDFRFNNEVDKANQKFVEELCDANLNASKEVGTENKYIKNIKKFLEAVEKIDKIAVEDEAYYKDLGKPELYDYFTDRSIAILEKYCTELEPKLPSLKSELYTVLSETTEVLGGLTDAINFTKALVLSITMQETQMELIQDIINTQSSSSTLYKGMTRLKKQLSNGFVTYFTGTYIADKAYDKIIGYLPKLTSNAVLGGWKSYGSAVTAVVGLVNSVVFKGWLGYDYSKYTSAVMLTQYAADLYNSVRNKAGVFGNQFDNGEIQKFETLYNAYITMKASAYKECKNLAKYNSTHGSEYANSESDYFDTENAYQKYIEGVKSYIGAIPKANRIATDYGEWKVNGNTVIQNASDSVEDNVIYAVDKRVTQEVYSESYDILIRDSLSISKISIGSVNKLPKLSTSTKDVHVSVDKLYCTAPSSPSSGVSICFDSIDITVNSLKISGYLGTRSRIYLRNSNVTINDTFNLLSQKYLYIDEGSVLKANDIIVQASGGQYTSVITVNDGRLKCNNLYLYEAPQATVAWGSPAQSYLVLNDDSASVEIMGNLIVDGITDYRDTTGNVSVNKGSLYAHGDIIFSSIYNYTKSYRKIFLCGERIQRIKNVPIYNLEIDNPYGVSLESDISIYGDLNTNDNPIKQNGYSIRLNTDSKICGNTHFDSVYIDSPYSLTSELYCERLVVNGPAKATLTIAEKTRLFVSGNLEVRYWGIVKNYGESEIIGDLLLRNDDTPGYADTKFYNYNQTSVFGDIICGTNSYIFMENKHSVLSVKGDINLVSNRYGKVSSGTTILLGDEKQSITNYDCPTFIIENESEEGVVFETKISPSVLFNHNGNKFTLKSGGTFIDYDGDGLKDDVDPMPTVGNPCTLYFKSEDAEKGTVSLGKVETVGGTEITVTATPTFKYYFVKWINSSGTTVSTSAVYTSVVTENETYTAIFAKRQRPIIVRMDGGKIHAPTRAEIESEVTVTVSENDGYVYTDGSLSCNGIPVENGSFIMPDEAVVLTAEFVRNEGYFSLNEALTAAMAYTYEAYSKASFANLTSVINAAKTALVNNVTAEESENQIALLQSAIDGLEDKYIATVTLKTTPTLYIRVPDMIDHIPVLITYDNGTTITVTGADCMIEGYDASILGKQSITVTYGGVSGTVNVNVEKRLLSDCTVSEIADLIYDGIKTEYTQTPVVVYSLTNEVLTEGVDFEVAYADNSTIGVAKIIVTGIGDYTGSRTITFNIYCAHNYVVTEQVDPTCTEDGYQIEKCTICGAQKPYEMVVTEGLPESDHNYGNNLDVSYYYTNAGASSLLLKFSDKTFTESGYDKIYIYDGSGTLIGTYTGNSLAGKTITASGDAVRIRLTTDGSVNKYGFSLDSITALFARRLLPKIEHIYGDWSVVTPATPNETGVKHRLCTACGAEETGEIPAVVGLSFKGASLSLHHNLAINYKVDKALFEEVGYTDPYVVFEIGGKKVTVRAYTVEGERYVFRFRNIAPNQMNDTIYATLYATYNGVKYASEVREYSVAEYCYTTLAKYSADAYAELRTLLVDLLHYGAQSQLYTKHQTDNLADANLTEQQLLWGTADDPTLTNSLNTAYRTVEDPLVTWKGASLKLNDSVLMRFKFIAEDIEDLSLKITGETGEWTLTSKDFVSENGVYFVYFSGLNAGQMSEKVYLTMYKNGVAVSNTVCYSIESYAYSKKDSTIQYLSDLVKAMMKYGNAARAYAN